MLANIQNFTLMESTQISTDVSKSMDMILMAVESNQSHSPNSTCDLKRVQSNFSNSQHDDSCFNLFDASIAAADSNFRHETNLKIPNLQCSQYSLNVPNVEKEVADHFDTLLQSVESILSSLQNQKISEEEEETEEQFDISVQDSRICWGSFDDIHLPDCTCDPTATEVASDSREVAEALSEEYSYNAVAQDSIDGEVELVSSEDMSNGNSDEISGGHLMQTSDSYTDETSEEPMSSSLIALPGDVIDGEVVQPENLRSLVIPVVRESVPVGDRDELLDELNDNDFVERMMVFFREMELMNLMEDNSFSLGTGDHSDRI